jgi:hypothetical protein
MHRRRTRSRWWHWCGPGRWLVQSFAAIDTPETLQADGGRTCK